MTKAKAKEYWFARRFPLGSPRSGLAPVHWKGWLCALIFVAVLLLGAGAFAYFALRDEFPHGAAIFAVLAIVGGGWFILVSQANADRVRTVADYKREKMRV
jgi:hypothetical protein